MKIKLGPVTLESGDLKSVGGALEWFTLPKCPKATIGVVVAIDTENDHDKARLENDLVRELGNSLDRMKAVPFKLLQYPNSISQRINTEDTAAAYLFRSRAHFMIYGHLAKRQASGKETYVFRLNGLVLHKAVSANVRSVFSKEFRELLPSTVRFPVSEELLGFEFTEIWIRQVSQYIIGCAAMISDDNETAIALFNNLAYELSHNQSDDVPIVHELKKKIPARLREIYRNILANHFRVFERTRDRNVILGCADYFEKLKELEFDDYSLRLKRAVFFYFQGNLDGAIAELSDLREQDITWRYSLGFLYAFKGDIQNALEQYKKAAYGEVEPHVFNEIDLFISEVITAHPDKPHLRFFRGLINLKGKLDYELAQQDFEWYLFNSSADESPRLSELSKKYLAESKRHLGL